MKRRAIIASFILAWMIGILVYTLYRYSALLLEEPVSQIGRPEETVLQAPSTQQQDQLIPPPPRTSELPASPSQPEAPRVLINTTREQLSRIERYLPDGAHIATYPIDQTRLQAAITKADTNNDGIDEMIVVHTRQSSPMEEATPQLFVSVLTSEGESLKVRSSSRLVDGGVLFAIDVNGVATPLVVQDITSDDRPEIIVASGIGASLGGAIQVFSIERESLQHLADVGGHFFQMRSKGDGEPSEITARSRDERKAITYKWNGRKLEQVKGN